MTPTETLTILRRARKHVARPGGWHQGDFAPDRDARRSAPCCMLGAINWAMTGNPRSDRYKDSRAYAFLNDLLLARGQGFLVTWNDTLGRTQAEVVALFDEAIALYIKEGAE